MLTQWHNNISNGITMWYSTTRISTCADVHLWHTLQLVYSIILHWHLQPVLSAQNGGLIAAAACAFVDHQCACTFGEDQFVWQGQAEYYLEKLHGEVEKQLELFLKNQKTPEEWKKFRETLIGATDVTKSHFDKLVQVWHHSALCCSLGTPSISREIPLQHHVCLC